jgi:membrane AbrB-like protein
LTVTAGLRQLGRLLLTAALGAAGGTLFAWLGLPAAWLAGSMTAVAAAALAGLPVDLPAPVRNAAFVLLGVSMGTSVTPETMEQLRAWPLSLALLAGSVAATLMAGALYLRRVHGWDPVTARYASIPGALSSVLVLAATSAADLPRVALAQSVRLFTLVALMPAILSFLGDGAGAGPPTNAAVTSTLPEIVVTLTASAAIAGLLAALHVPGGVLLGAMVASAALHGTGLVAGRLPPGLLILGFSPPGRSLAPASAAPRSPSSAARCLVLWAACSSRSPFRPGSRPSAPLGSACPSASSGWPTPRAGLRPWRSWRWRSGSIRPLSARTT